MICPVCGEKTFARKKVVMEGWKAVATIEVCALCGAELPKKESSAASLSAPATEKRDRLSALLGGETVKNVTLAGSADRDFCRNCANFLAHPFKNLCALSEQEADPNGTCPDFREKNAASPEKS